MYMQKCCSTQISSIASETRRTRMEYKALQHILDSEESDGEFIVDNLYTTSNLVAVSDL